jgi:hypothetical protein
MADGGKREPRGGQLDYRALAGVGARKTRDGQLLLPIGHDEPFSDPNNTGPSAFGVYRTAALEVLQHERRLMTSGANPFACMLFTLGCACQGCPVSAYEVSWLSLF